MKHDDSAILGVDIDGVRLTLQGDIPTLKSAADELFSELGQ